MDNYRIRQAGEGFYIIEEETVRCFLLVGTKKALLIDCGSMLEDVRGIVEGLTKLPVMLAITHADGDHIHCCSQFSPIYMSPNEYAFYHNTTGRNDDLRPLWDGDVIDLGDRDVRVIYNPGHTSGSITFLDKNSRSLVGGDSIQNGKIFLFGACRDLLAFLHTMGRIQSMTDQFDQIYPAHADCPVPASIIQPLIEGTIKVLKGEVEGTPDFFMDTPIRVFDIGAAKLLYESKKEFFE